MTIPSANPLAYEGVEAQNPPTVIIAQRAPTSSDVGYAIGTLWVDQPSDDAYQLTSIVSAVANWTILGSSSSTILDVPHGGTGRATLTNHGVLVGAGTSAITQLSVGATGTLLAGSTGADPAFTGSPSVSGSLTAGTTITATLGAITATNGNVVLGTAGNKLVIATGSNASVGTSAAMTAGAVTVATTASSATAKIFYSRATTGGTPGNVSITAQDGTGFTLTSTSNTETSTFNWWIINA